MIKEWPDPRRFCYLKYTFNKPLHFNTKNSENERSIPVIGSFVYFKKPNFPHRWPIKEKKTFAFKRNLRGIRGVKPTVQYLCTSNRTKVPTKVLM